MSDEASKDYISQFLLYASDLTIEFEPMYMIEFNTHLRLKELLTYTLCAIELRQKVGRENPIVRTASQLLRDFLSTPLSALEAYMLTRIEHELGSKQDVQLFRHKLEEILNILEAFQPVSDEDRYRSLHSFVQQRLDKLNRINKQVEEKALGQFRSTRSYYI